MSTFKTSAEIIQTVCTIGGNKPKVAFVPAVILAFLAGAYIGFGSLLAHIASAGIPAADWGNLTRVVFAGVFPLGLLCVVVAGADLFTGNCMYGPAAVMHKTASLGGMLKNWFISYFGNLVGSVFIAFFLGHLTGLFMPGGPGAVGAASVVNLANIKCAMAFDVAFWRGVGCNWLVCLAIYLSLSSGDGVSKAVMIWPPIAGFVAIGFEHSVANMTFIPLGIFVGSAANYAGAVPLTASWGGLVNNLIPVTLGNIVGGALFVAMFYYKANNLKPAE